MTDEEILKRAKDAERRTRFGELVHSPVSNGVNSAYGIGFIEGMVEYRNSLQEEPVSDTQSPVLFYGLTGSVGSTKQEPVSEELEKELSAYVNSKEYTNSIGSSGLLLIARHFAQWQKQQLMKDAVEGEVCDGYKYLPHAAIIINKNNIKPLKTGDKIKLIIVKED